MIARLLFVLAITSALTACGSSKSGGNASGGTACTSTFDALCQRACTCGGGTCAFVLQGANGPIASVDYDNLASCELLYSLGCGMDGGVREDFDYAGCASAAQAAACVAAPGGGMGAAYPAICDVNSSDAGTGDAF